ncbi:hypothetical protein BSNK01_30400 [Bacillaceae bacterium]
MPAPQTVEAKEGMLVPVRRRKRALRPGTAAAKAKGLADHLKLGEA